MSVMRSFLCKKDKIYFSDVILDYFFLIAPKYGLFFGYHFVIYYSGLGLVQILRFRVWAGFGFEYCRLI